MSASRLTPDKPPEIPSQNNPITPGSDKTSPTDFEETFKFISIHGKEYTVIDISKTPFAGGAYGGIHELYVEVKKHDAETGAVTTKPKILVAKRNVDQKHTAEETRALEVLNEAGKKSGICYWYATITINNPSTGEPEEWIILKKYDTNLSKHLEGKNDSFRQEFALKAAPELLTGFMTLLKSGVGNVDIKLANMLFRSKKMEIVLADMGKSPVVPRKTITAENFHEFDKPAVKHAYSKEYASNMTVGALDNLLGEVVKAGRRGDFETANKKLELYHNLLSTVQGTMIGTAICEILLDCKPYNVHEFPEPGSVEKFMATLDDKLAAKGLPTFWGDLIQALVTEIPGFRELGSYMRTGNTAMTLEDGKQVHFIAPFTPDEVAEVLGEFKQLVVQSQQSTT